MTGGFRTDEYHWLISWHKGTTGHYLYVGRSTTIFKMYSGQEMSMLNLMQPIDIATSLQNISATL